MTIDFKALAPTLRDAVALAETGAKVLPGPAGVVAGIIGAALSFAADLAAAGHDPLTHIERIHAADPVLAETESEWRDALRRKFGGA